MGFVVDMTFRVIPLDTLEIHDEVLPVKEYFLEDGKALKNLIEGHNGWVELFWVPFNGEFWMKSWKQSSAPATKPHHTISDKMGSLFQRLIYALPMLEPDNPRVRPLTTGPSVFSFCSTFRIYEFYLVFNEVWISSYKSLEQKTCFALERIYS